MTTRPVLMLSAAVVAVMVLASTWAWLQLPADAQVPIHWGINGAANAFAGKTIGLFLLPAVAVGVLALQAVIPRIEPRAANLARSGPAYRATFLAVVGLLAVVHFAAIADALGADLNVVPPVLLGVGVLFIVIGNYLPKVRSNFLFGIRTPWTLTSELSWNRTHRLGGRLFVLAGAVMIVGVLVLPPAWDAVLIVIDVGLVLGILFPYSYVVWRDDPDRRIGV